MDNKGKEREKCACIQERDRERFGACMVLRKGGGASTRLEDGVGKLAREVCMK